MRRKPIYNDLRLTYQDKDGTQQQFYCSEVSRNKSVNILLGMPTKDSGARYITTDDVEFIINGVIIDNTGAKHRIQNEPETRPLKDNNGRRGAYRQVKVIETT